MPKPAKNLWPLVLEWDNLLLAAKEAARTRRYRAEVLRFNAYLEENLLDLQRLLRTGQWHPGPYRQFYVYEPKKRLVHAPWYPDRVLHHALVQIIGPYFERRFIDQSFACRVGKGTHAASDYLSSMLRSAHAGHENVFVLKADISKYFYSIDHDILLRVIARIIGDKYVLEILRRLVRECGCIEGNRGLPLGALTSQLMANAYLDQLDHFVKDNLGVKYYVRYMDDFVILGSDKQKLWQLLATIREFLDVRLHLALNVKTRVFPASQGVDFAGYRHWPAYKLPRKRNVRRAARRFAGLTRCYAAGKVDMAIVRCCVASFVGYMKPCKGWRSAESALDRLVLVNPSSKNE